MCIRDRLRNKQQDLFGLFLSSLRQRMEKSGEIRINEKEMQNLTKGGLSDEGY